LEVGISPAVGEHAYSEQPKFFKQDKEGNFLDYMKNYIKL